MTRYSFAFIFSLALLLGCGRDRQGQSGDMRMEVRTLKIVEQTIPAVFESVGILQSSHEVEIRARVEGYLEKIVYREGGFVKQGDLLYLLDRKPFEAALEDAKGYLAMQEAILWNAQRSVKRLQPLYDQKAASRKDLDSAISDELSAQAAVQSAKAKLMEAELNLSYTTIRSPISGLAADSNYYEGALITPGSTGLLTTVSVLNPIWVYFSMSEGDVLKMEDERKKGLISMPKEMAFEVELTLADGAVYPFKGKLNFTSPTLDIKTGTLSVRAEVSNPDNQLIPGQFVRAKVLGAMRPNAIIVPQKAVLQGKGGMYVYVVDKEGKAAIQEIEVGDWYGEDWIVKKGLIAGDTIIIDGVNKVQPGMAVKVIE